MAFLDIEQLSAPVRPDRPAGENLEYDPAFQELERAAKGREGVYNIVTKKMEGAVEPDWPRVRDLATELCGRTKDLRVAVHLCGAAIALGGLPAFADSLALIHRLLDSYWADVYPQLVEEEGNDPIDRINVLENLCSPDGVMRYLRMSTLVEARGVGRFSLRDLDLAEGRQAPRENESVPALALLQGAWQEGDTVENAARQAAVEAVLDHLKAIRTIFQRNTSVAPNLDPMVRMLQPVRDFYARMSQATLVEEQDDMAAHETDIKTSEGDATITSARWEGRPGSRRDAIRQLKLISDYLKENEPSSPAPLLIDRAARLLEMGFVDIVRELMPDARERIELIGGFKFDEQK